MTVFLWCKVCEKMTDNEVNGGKNSIITTCCDCGKPTVYKREGE